MQQSRMVVCILAAMIGAGFASGCEIMQFFSQYGIYSWLLILISGIIILLLIYKFLQSGEQGIFHIIPSGQGRVIWNAIMFLLQAAAGGGMGAAAGELAALAIPFHGAQELGLVCTIIIAMAASRYPIGALEGLGKILIPLLIIAFLLSMRIPGQKIVHQEMPFHEMLLAVIKALGYAGMNVMLSAGILCETGISCKKRGICRGAAWAGGAILGMLLLGNVALIQHQELKGAALPMVVLLQHYGKFGFYLAAAILYLAILSTLIAVLQGMTAFLSSKLKHPRIAAGLLAGAMALLGFEQIIGVAYPALGFCGLAFLITKKEMGEAYSASRTYSRMR